MSLFTLLKQQGFIQVNTTFNTVNHTRTTWYDRERRAHLTALYRSERQLEVLDIKDLRLNDMAHLTLDVRHITTTGTYSIDTLTVTGSSSLQLDWDPVTLRYLTLNNSELTHITTDGPLDLICHRSSMNACRLTGHDRDFTLVLRQSHLRSVHVNPQRSTYNTYLESCNIHGNTHQKVVIRDRWLADRTANVVSQAHQHQTLLVTHTDPTGTILNLHGKLLQYNLLTTSEGEHRLTLDCWNGSLDDFETLLTMPADTWPSWDVTEEVDDETIEVTRARYQALLALLRLSVPVPAQQ